MIAKFCKYPLTFRLLLQVCIIQIANSQQSESTYSSHSISSSSEVLLKSTANVVNLSSTFSALSKSSRETTKSYPNITTVLPTNSDTRAWAVTTSESPLPPVITASPASPLNFSFYPTLNKAVFRPVFTNIRNGERHVYPFDFTPNILSKWPGFQIQFYAEADEQFSSLEVDNNYPLHVAVHWHGCIKSWDIPINYLNHTMSDSRKTDRFTNHSVGKTLWLYPEKTLNKTMRLTVEVSIVSEVTVYYKIRIISLRNLVVPPYKSIMGAAAYSSPAFFKFDVPHEDYWEYAFIHVVSDTDICTLMTVQQPRGPFLEIEDNPKQKQFTETFTMKTGLTIKVTDFPKGFLIVFMPFLDDEKCKTLPDYETPPVKDFFRLKMITFEVREGTSPFKHPYYYPLAIPVGLFCFIAVIAICAHCYFHRYRITRNQQKKPNWQSSLHHRRRTMEYQSNMTINQLIITEPSRVVGQTNRYCTAGFVTSAFYSVPVFQLIFTFSHRLVDTGNFDICFFNHFCSHMVGTFHDFNHMYSNIWYILFGLLFQGLVRIRQMTYIANYDERSEGEAPKSLFNKIFPKTDGRLDIGVMTHYGLLYCMGYALVMTGVMSAAYHICPNQSNFQFDTVFMYTIAAITVVTIYQARHPTYLSANFTFTALAMVTCITVLGLLWEEFFIRVIFSVVHMWFLILSLPKVCYNGYVRKDGRLVAHWFEMLTILKAKVKDDWANRRTFRVQRVIWHHPEIPCIEIIPGPGRLVLPGFLLFINCAAIAGTWTVLAKQNFATQVLFICVVNGSFYTVFYSVLKFFHGECRDFLWIQPGIYLALSFALWGYAMYYFLDEVSTWESSPAVSRLKNTDCIFLQFYDSHDMWHFLSAAALFCSAMVLLTVDDDLLDRHKETIPVF